MCGTVSIVGTVPVDRELLLRMRDVLTHRGPDASGHWLSEDRTVALGHRRLSIIDLAHGSQPMVSDDGSVVLNYNGEIYNHRSLRESLAQAGRRFYTRCDTEVVLAAYEAFGTDCVQHLDGMFAFTVWDARRSQLFFARDRLGKKPLYLAETRSGWVFASEIKAVLEHPDVERRVDEESLAHYLSFLATPAPRTLFKGIRKVPPGSCGTWRAQEGLRLWQWWRVPAGDGLDVTPGEAARSVHELFERAVEKRMMSDVPFGAYLSGGIDSTANVAVMSRFTDKPLHTLSIGFVDEPKLDELQHAEAVAKAIGTEHHTILIDDDDVLDALPMLIHHQDEPIADPVCVPLFHLAKHTKREGISVVQVGEGSDEIFFGYSGYTQVLRTIERVRRIRKVVPPAILRAGARLALRDKPLGLELLLEMLRDGFPSARRVAGFAESEKRALLGRLSSPSAYEFIRSAYGSGSSVEEIADVTLLHELTLRLPELLLMRVDKMTMAFSVEARAPFLDRDLVEYAARLPLGLKWQDGNGKLVLKQAMRGIVPDSVLARRKQGFGAPVWRWAERFRDMLEREIDREPLHEYFDAQAVRRLVTREAAGPQAFRLWILLNFALWHRHWIEREELDDLVPSTSRLR
jgi:asparagine synthase (glutamine-hydrolysing)